MKKSKQSCCQVSRSAFMHIDKKSQLQSSQEKKCNMKDMALLNDGEFLMGTNDKEGFKADGEGPVRKVSVTSFYIDKYTVTNREFQEFIEDTGYKTDAEQFGWSFVFGAFLPNEYPGKIQQLPQTPWWFATEKAYWFQPEGIGSTVDSRLDHPVVHISWNDAIAYCKWAGKRLPTEKEWEYAARGGLEQKKFPWGDTLTIKGEYYCNIWQGEFPHRNTKEDGFIGTAPANSYPPNGYGLYNVSGNVWEWCADHFQMDRNGKVDQDPVDGDIYKVMRGGSYLCHHSYCNRYRVAARSANTVNSSSGNMGFRCVKDI